MKTALAWDGPVVFVDHKRLFPTAGEVPVAQTAIPFGQALVRRTGHDVTLATHSYMTRVALEAAEGLAALGISCEVIDLRSLAPLDVETVAASAARTGALVTLEEGQLSGGVGVELIYRVCEITGPLVTGRIGARPAPVSSNPVLEAAAIPDATVVVQAVQARLSARQVRP
jgi:pyruvate/2-oxoglutarate/acetoin dehydrogenase E1 component